MIRLGVLAWVTASFISTAVADGNTDHNSAIAPVTKGAAILVPPRVSGFPSAPRLVIASPGAHRPRLPTELPRLERLIGLPWRSQATTGITHGWRVIGELPMAPWLPEAATVMTPRLTA